MGDVKCSDRMYADIKKHGGEPVLWKTGHSLIKEKVKSDKAPFGGEMSGHIFFADRNYGYDDAPYAGLRLCEIISKTGKTIPELLEGLPTAFNTPEIRIDCLDEKKFRVVEAIREQLIAEAATISTMDGVRVSRTHGWWLLRASNTQSVLVARCESSTVQGLNDLKEEIAAYLAPHNLTII